VVIISLRVHTFGCDPHQVGCRYQGRPLGHGPPQSPTCRRNRSDTRLVPQPTAHPVRRGAGPSAAAPTDPVDQPHTAAQTPTPGCRGIACRGRLAGPGPCPGRHPPVHRCGRSISSLASCCSHSNNTDATATTFGLGGGPDQPDMSRGYVPPIVREHNSPVPELCR